MILLPSLVPLNSTPSTPTVLSIADLLTKTLPHHQFLTITGDILPATSPATTVASTTVVAPTVVDPATVNDTASALVPTAHPNSVAAPTPFFVDTGASFAISPFLLDYLPVTSAPSGLCSTSVLVAASKVASITPYTLIRGEDDVSVDSSTVDLSSADCTDSDSEFTTVSGPIEFRKLGTATLILLYSKSPSELIHILVEPTPAWFDWIDWIPLPRLVLQDSYFHLFGLDYLQVFPFFHTIPIWTALALALLRSE